MISREPIRAYMRALASQLKPLDRADAQEVLQEIEGHIHDVVDQADARGEDLDIPALLQGFGPPETLAAQYIAHVQYGAPPPAGFRVIERVKLTVTRGLFYSMGAFGFSVALFFLLLAIAKVIDPASVGMWSSAGGTSITLTWSGPPDPQARELLGYGLVPIAMLASAWCAEVTRRVLRVLRRSLN